MPITAAADGHGATLTFAGFVANLLSIDGPNFSRPAIESTHMGSTTSRSYIPADLVEPGEISCEVEFDVQALPPISGAAATLVIVWGSGATLKTWTWTNGAFMTSYKGGAKTGERMTGSATFKLTLMPVVS